MELTARALQALHLELTQWRCPDDLQVLCAGLRSEIGGAEEVRGGKSRGHMTLSELEAAIGWLERDRLSEDLHALEGDPRYAWSARKGAEWKPPLGRDRRSVRQPQATA